MKEPIISFINYSLKYHSQAKPTLKNINLSIYPGEKVLIVGPSGSGKSTLAHAINGLIPFSYNGEITGELTVDGMVAEKESLFSLSNSVGTVLQDPDGQFIGLTVAEDIAFSLENKMIVQNEMLERTRAAANSVGVVDYLNASPQDLSGGQKQRVALAGVLIDRVPILLFDEPLANLDPATGTQSIDLIDNIQKIDNVTIIIIEHRLEDVLFRHVDRIIVVNDGEIVADTTPNKLISQQILKEVGIREPLYVTALKYAGVDIAESKKPAYINTLDITSEDKQRVMDWYTQTNPKPRSKKNQTVLQAENITFSYTGKKNVLEDVTFNINKGEIVAIVGSNGAGKSTLSKVICGFESLDNGKILLNGEDMKNYTIARRAGHVGYVMQNPNQMISKTMIFDEVALGLLKDNLSEAELKSRVEETLKICGLYQFRSWPISALSFGQKKRVTIASVLVLRPEIIILDEPTAGQDFRHYTEIMEFLNKLNSEGVTIIMITHDMHLMLEYAERALVFSESRLIADTTTAEVLTNRELIQKASLKETSLFGLSNLCGINDSKNFVEHFINYDREVRKHE